MINYKQILEAVNRGIKFALDDFENQDDIQGQFNSKVNHQHGTKEYLDLMEEVVDLGLPSRTLWCKSNLGADCSNTSESWYGKYYAWGELEDNKQIYDWDYYVHGCSPYNLYKYVNNKEYAADDNDNKVDNLTELLPEDDAAFQFKKCHNYKFHIPTKEQFEELLAYTKNYWVNNYDPNKLVHNLEDDKGIQGLNGRVFVGKNANQLFIPAAGCRSGSDIYNVGSCCILWSSSLDLDDPSYAYYLHFSSRNVYVNSNIRCIGYSVRSVINL